MAPTITIIKKKKKKKGVFLNHTGIHNIQGGSRSTWLKEDLARQGSGGINGRYIRADTQWKAVDPVVQHWSLRRTAASKGARLIVPRLGKILVCVGVDEINDKVGERVVHALEEGERQAEEGVWTAD